MRISGGRRERGCVFRFHAGFKRGHLMHSTRIRACWAIGISALAWAAAPASAVLIYATSGSQIASFDSASPTVVSSVAVSGMALGEHLVGIDTRPATQQLYGVGSTNHLYVIHPVTGAAIQVGPANQFDLHGGGIDYAVDFDPVTDRLRVIDEAGHNFRLNPDDGSLTTDTNIAPSAGVSIVGAAYDRNGAGSSPTTTLYAIDNLSGT